MSHPLVFTGADFLLSFSGFELIELNRILAVADCFDALVSERPYRAGMPLPTVIRMISDGAGTQFDPQIVDVFRRVMARENEPMTGKDTQAELQIS